MNNYLFELSECDYRSLYGKKKSSWVLINYDLLGYSFRECSDSCDDSCDDYSIDTTTFD